MKDNKRNSGGMFSWLRGGNAQALKQPEDHQKNITLNINETAGDSLDDSDRNTLKTTMMDLVVFEEDPMVEFFREYNVAKTNRYFRKRQCITVTMCILALTLSQIDLKLSSKLLTSSDTEAGSKTQAIHTTTAIVLFAIGAVLEYSEWMNHYVFFISMTVVLAKCI